MASETLNLSSPCLWAKAQYAHILRRMNLITRLESAIHSVAETVLSPTDVRAKAAGRASIHSDSAADKNSD
ncbi:hypothetical protein CDAR_423691 [Caerostris darwini]|uniref:Uncharacterized protein n=1 Tax=Caerostris darwini TaxID=1538125 RepID=A0AAV4VC94_9ARAC|nr:hypothetical protein CDAR_423691 [Caerostris darwini]